MTIANTWGALAAGAALAVLTLTAAHATPIGGGVPQRYDGTDPNAEYKAGLSALEDGKYRDAKFHFERVLSVMHDHPVALFRLGEAEDGLGHIKEAARDYQASLKQDPKQIRAASELAVDEEKLGQHQQAMAQLEQFQQRAAACGDSCPDADDLAAAVKNIQSAMPPAADGLAATPTQH